MGIFWTKGFSDLEKSVILRYKIISLYRLRLSLEGCVGDGLYLGYAGWVSARRFIFVLGEYYFNGLSGWILVETGC